MPEMTFPPATMPINCPRHRPCIEMSYYDGGTGETLVLIHGLGADAAGWIEQLGELSTSYRVIAMDLRGHGGSGQRAEEPATIRAFADDIAALLKGLRVDGTHVCGNSMGGMIVLELFVRYPSLIKSLILEDTTAFFPPPNMMEDFLRFFDHQDMRGWARFMAPRLLRPQSLMSLEDELVQTMATTSRGVYRQGLVAAFQADYRWMLPTVDIPTLILVGDEDQATPRGYARFLQAQIKGSVLQVVPEAAHLPHRENPRAFNGLLRSHLEGIKQK
jgi:pimeloyl-ACP methyl ester carboxylesterase